MANSEYSLDSLVESVKRRGAIPQAQGTFTAADFQKIANEELLTYILPILQARREDYYLKDKYVTVASPDTTIANYPAWKIPSDAIASTLRDVQAVSSSGALFSIARLVVDDIPSFISNGFFIHGEYVALAYNLARSPLPIQLRLIYHRRPQPLVYEASAFYVGAKSGNNVLTCIGPLAGATLNDQAIVLDHIRGQSGFDSLDEALACTFDVTINTTVYSITVPAATYAKATVGDFLSGYGTTPIPQIPIELHPLLAQRMTVKFLESQGEQEQLASAMQIMQDMESKIPLLIQPRVEGKPKKLIPRMSVWRRWRW